MQQAKQIQKEAILDKEKLMQIQWHALSVDEVLKLLNTNKSGLTEEQALKRLEFYGKNEIKEKQISAAKIFFRQFNSILIYILLFASFIAAFLQHWIDFSVILAIVVINGILGFVQEYKAEKAIQKLKQLLQPSVLVKRNGKVQKINASLLVPGDIILLQAGDKVMADCRLIEVNDLMTNDASLTGESMPQQKFVHPVDAHTALADRDNMVWQGTEVVNGKGVGVVIATNGLTQYGKIASMIARTETKTPLQVKLERFSKKLGILVIIMAVLFFLVGWLNNLGLLNTFLTAISLAVAAVPEGLPAVVTIALAIALNRMLKVNTLIRKLPAAEGLGSVTAICVDKTGTITTEEMTARKVVTAAKTYEVSGSGFNKQGYLLYNGKQIKFDNENLTNSEVELYLLLKACLLCNNADAEQQLGDPTELALKYLAYKAGLTESMLQEKRIVEFPFTPSRKMMSVIVESEQQKFVYAKGAPEKILELCTTFMQDSKIMPFTRIKKQELLNNYKELAMNGYRVIALAFKPISYVLKQKIAESSLTFLGFVAIYDPPKQDVASAIEACKHAGIKVFMITGDSSLTALSIANQVGLQGKAIEGSELDNLTIEQLAIKIKQGLRIFARTTPEQKLKIIDALKKNGEIVAMFGDGINDAPALKKADIGVAMGKRGTEVTKEVADIIILDDNLASMVEGIKQGRTVNDNIKKFVNYLLTCNIAEVLIVFILSLFRKLALLPSQILWINLLTDGLPAVALAADPSNPNIMYRKAKKQEILDRQLLWLIFGIGIKKAALLITVYLVSIAVFPMYANTILFTSVVLYEFNRIFVIRMTEKLRLFCNKWLNLSIALSVALQLILLYSPFGSLFHVYPLLPVHWIFIIAILVIGFISSYLVTKVILKYIHE